MTAPDAAVLAWQQTVNRAWDQMHGGLRPASGYGPSGPPPTGPRPPGNVAQWTQQAFGILRANGVPASQLDAGAVGIIIAHESSGNPDAINKTDSNWVKGIPSKGLMQTIDPTFDKYALPGHHDIYNPVDNIVAGTRYAISRYGSLGNVPGVKLVRRGQKYVGY
jgi:hypothetical protein